MSKRDVLQLKNNLNNELAKIKALLGQDPMNSRKSLAQMQEELREGLNKKNWVKSVRMIMLIERFRDSIISFEETVEKFKKMILLSILGMITECLCESNPKIRFRIPSKRNRRISESEN
jgi:hypothetical protein